MSESLAVGHAPTPPAARAAAADAIAALDPRRRLQLALGVVWVLDGILQYQPSMFTKSFPDMLAQSAHGSPAVVAGPITWSASLVDHHVAVLNAAFATIQLALGLGIAWRPTVRLALAASIVWSLAVWWLGEGFGGILAGTASPVNGAPGPVLLYAVLAALLWPAERDPGAPCVAARVIGRRPAQAVWLVLWASLAAFALLPASRAPGAISDMFSGGASGAPAWLAWIDTHAASALNHHGLAASVVLAVLLALVAVAVYLPAPAVRVAIVLAIVLAAALWLAQGMGELFTGLATDPGSGPLLALLALTFWPAPGRPAPGRPAPARPAPLPTPPLPPQAGPPQPVPPQSVPPQSVPPQSVPPYQPRRPDMGGPAWLTAIFAAASLAVAVYCAGRLVAARRWRRPTELDTDGAHVVIGVAMAGMLVSGLRTLPSAIWEVVFAAGVAWFGYRTLQTRRDAQPSPWRSSHPLPHLVECAAMVFMFLILPAGGVTMTATGSRFSFLTLPLALFLFGYVVWLGDRVTLHAAALAIAGPASPGSGPGFAAAQSCLAPRCAAICKITMGITMGYMLILML